jgi:SAM-dependent methyltransferase
VLKNLVRRKKRKSGLGLDLKPGDKHYRAYVGPPKDYDLISAMVFNLLTCLGLRQHHRLLDIGCGSLRVGRLLIPYLNEGNYYGVEPNKWLVTDGIDNELGRDLIKVKKPTFSFNTSMEEFKHSLDLDYAIAQSIFSHCGLYLIEAWLSQVSFHLKENGALLGTFLVADKDYNGRGWVYPECVSYQSKSISEIASKFELNFDILNWAHPRQTWALFSKKNYDKSLLNSGPISWNRFIAKAVKRN